MTPPLPSARTLQLLLARLDGVQVLGLGEPTHGTSEAFRWKSEVIRALAQTGRLRVLAWEGGFVPGRLLNEAVVFGRGDLGAALHALRLWPWQTREVLDVLTWLRGWNLARPEGERVRFVGVDVQDPHGGVRELIEAGHGHPALTALTQRGQVQAGSTQASELLAILEAVEQSETQAPLRTLARNACRFVDAYLLEADHARLGLRDRFMAETLLEEALEPGGLTVFWAHNEHVAVNPDFHGAPAAGWALRERLGAAYLAAGVLMGEGTFRARDLDAPERPPPLTTLPIGLPAAHQSEALFAGRGDTLHDTRGHPHPGPRRFLGTHYGVRQAQAEPHTFELARPLSDFDLVMFLERTTPTQPLPATAPAPR